MFKTLLIKKKNVYCIKIVYKQKSKNFIKFSKTAKSDKVVNSALLQWWALHFSHKIIQK